MLYMKRKNSQKHEDEFYEIDLEEVKKMNIIVS